MPINLLGQDGPNLIRLHIDQQASHRDRWKLFLIKDIEAEESVTPESLMTLITENMASYEGKIASDDNNALMLLVRLQDEETTKQYVTSLNDVLPENVMGHLAGAKGKKGDIQTLTLSLGPAQAKARSDESNTLLKKRTARQEKRALIVDDDSFIRSLFSASLDSQLKIIEVADGEDVLDAYMEHLPDIVLLDLHLPGKTGFEVLEELIGQDRDAYVIIVSADSVQENVLKAKQAGARGFLTKPARREKLLEYISRCPTIEYSQLVSGLKSG